MKNAGRKLMKTTDRYQQNIPKGCKYKRRSVMKRKDLAGDPVLAKLREKYTL